MSIETAYMYYNIVFMRGKKSCKGWISLKGGVTVWWPNFPAKLLTAYHSLIKIKNYGNFMLSAALIRSTSLRKKKYMKNLMKLLKIYS